MTITLGNGPPGIKACAGTVLNMDCHAEQLLGFPLGLVFLPVFLRSSRRGSTGCETLLLPECGGEGGCRGLQWVGPCNSQPHRAIGKHHKLYWKLLVWLNYNYSSERNTVLRHSFLSRGGLGCQKSLAVWGAKIQDSCDRKKAPHRSRWILFRLAICSSAADTLLGENNRISFTVFYLAITERSKTSDISDWEPIKSWEQLDMQLLWRWWDPWGCFEALLKPEFCFLWGGCKAQWIYLT